MIPAACYCSSLSLGLVHALFWRNCAIKHMKQTFQLEKIMSSNKTNTQ